MEDCVLYLCSSALNFARPSWLGTRVVSVALLGDAVCVGESVIGTFGAMVWTLWKPKVCSTAFGLFQRLALNLARRSSRETACRNVRTIVFEVVKGSRREMIPTEATVSLKIVCENAAYGAAERHTIHR